MEKRNPSKTQIDILIPLVEKDLMVFSHVIEYVRRNILHPIGDILIVAPNECAIRDICVVYNCNFIDENSVLPFSKEKINYRYGSLDRSGWIFQQLLKLSGDELSSKEHFLILDADTVLIQPHRFEFNNKILFHYSDEYHCLILRPMKNYLE